MQKLLLAVDKLSTWVGHAFSWFIVALTLHVTWEVFRRYALESPRAWAFDVMIYFYGILFMMAGAYTLSKNGHVRGDILYGFFKPRTQATIWSRAVASPRVGLPAVTLPVAVPSGVIEMMERSFSE